MNAAQLEHVVGAILAGVGGAIALAMLVAAVVATYATRGQR